MANMNSETRWIFFDLDGTLADSIDTMYTIYLRFLAKFNAKGTPEEFNEMNGLSLTQIVTLCKERYQIAENDLYNLYKNEIIHAYTNDVKPVSDAHNTLQKLHELGYQFLLTTAAAQEIAMAFIKQQNWEKYFNYYVFGDDVSKGKPDPEIYGLALKKANISSKTVIAIEDSPNGIKAAKGQNISVIGFANHHSKNDLINAGATRVISELNEIFSILES